MMTRKRIEIISDFLKGDEVGPQRLLILEVLLDIRDMMIVPEFSKEDNKTRILTNAYKITRGSSGEEP